MTVPTSTVPAAIDALLAILAAVHDTPGSPLATVTVVDGPSLQQPPPLEGLFIGWRPDEEPAVQLQQQFADAGARRRDETYVIGSYVEVRAGGTDLGARRRRAFEIVGAVEAALRGTDAAPEAPTLNGTVLWSELTTGNLLQDQSEDGAAAGLVFEIACRARI